MNFDDNTIDFVVPTTLIQIDMLDHLVSEPRVVGTSAPSTLYVEGLSAHPWLAMRSVFSGVFEVSDDLPLSRNHRSLSF